MPTAKTWIVTPNNSDDHEIKISADRYSFNETTGRHLFYKGSGDKEELVANLINVSVRAA